MSLQVYYNAGDDAFRNAYGADVFIGQTFSTVGAFNLNEIKLKLYRLGNPGTLTLDLYATSGEAPTGASLGQATFNGNLLTTDSGGEWVSFSFAPAVSLGATTHYAMVLKATSGDASNMPRWRADSSSPGYNSGVYIYTTTGGASWSSSGSYDMMFETYSEAGAGGGIVLAATHLRKMMNGD